MIQFHTDQIHAELKQKTIHEEVRNIHLGNRIHRAQKANRVSSAGGWLHVLGRLHRIRIQISFDLEDSNPEIKGAGC